MKKRLSLFLSSLAFAGVAVFSGCVAEIAPVTDVSASAEVTVTPLPPLVVEGTNPEQGVAGAFVSCDGTNVYVGGGALFPEKGPAEGGKKKFYDTIWQLDFADKESRWTAVSKMPAPMAYGVSAGNTWIGGENDAGKSDVQHTFFKYRDADVVSMVFPVKIDNAAGNFGFIGGGNIDGVPANKASRLFPHAVQELPDFPGTPRVQPVAGMLKTPRGWAYVLVGGFYFDKETKQATLDRAGVIYYLREKKWEMLPPLPESVSEAGLVGSCAVADGQGGLLIFGGVNAKIFKEALENPAPDYLHHESAWYKFNSDVLRLSSDKNGNVNWEKLATVPATARAGASVIEPKSGEGFVFICGELKPGFRSPDCCLIKIKMKD